jgi:hypothetical protein
MQTPQGIFKIPAGTYFVGDPCYSFDKKWDGILEQTDFFEKPVALDESGKPFAVAFNTAYGDGTYLDRHGRSYLVDAGLLGLVRCGAEDRSPEYADVKAVTFDGEVSCYVEENGHVIVFTDGRKTISIVTAKEDEDEDEVESAWCGDRGEDEDEDVF